LAEVPSPARVAEVAEAAAAIVRSMAAGPLDARTKADESPVTAIDLAVDRHLREALRALCPSAGWLSEETADSRVRLERELVWIVDPIDGTRSLIAGLPEYSVSIALVRSGTGPVVAVVANPVTGDTFTAERGAGAFDRSGRRLRTRAFDPAAPRLLASRTDLRGGLWRDACPATWLTPMGSLAWKMALVAAGRFDGHVTPLPRNEWDAAAGALLVAEAGGRSSDGAGGPLTFNRADPSWSGFAVASEAAWPVVCAVGAKVAQRWAALPRQ